MMATSSTSSLCFPATSAAGTRHSFPTNDTFLRCNRHRNRRLKLVVRSDLDKDVSDMRTNGAGLAGMSTAVELLDQGHEVDIYESRTFIGGKVGSFVDKGGNHIEMGLHVFFGCYNNLFRLLKKVGAEKNLLVKDHTHTFVNKGGEIGALSAELDFRFPVGAPLHGINAFLTTNQLKTYDKARNAVALALSPVVRALVDPDGAMTQIRNLDNVSFSEWFMSRGGTRASIQRMWDPVAYALGFIDCDNISARCMLTIFSLFATKTEASLLRMLKGSPDVYLSGPIRDYIIEKGGSTLTSCMFRDGIFDPLSYKWVFIWECQFPYWYGLVLMDYIDSMEGATLSGRQASAFICDAGEELAALRKQLSAVESVVNIATKSHVVLVELQKIHQSSQKVSKHATRLSRQCLNLVVKISKHDEAE
ncbi:zeta-carotene desaturase [Artemisia annua]|uniref:Zeta-carotene desaturase, chloroplastic/chromoplastic n=1 Tax=Artemisia annua TaxID=35608 RepID=A0A2U1MKD0_ARTAN|nr:zeta-carotene desaturase [Artemisia annua]